MSIDLRFGSTSHAFPCTFRPALEALVTSVEPRVGGRPVGPKALLGCLDTTCNSSSFKGIMKKVQTLIMIHLENMIRWTSIQMKVKQFLSTQWGSNN